MAEIELLSRGQDYLGNIARMLGDLQGVSTVIHELIQNADDAPGATEMKFTVRADRLEVWNDGHFDRCGDVGTPECAWIADLGHRCDFHSFRMVGSGDKRDRPGTTGAFGIGFTAVYQLTDGPELISSGEHWIVDETAAHDGRISRVVGGSDMPGTTFRLPWATTPSAFRTAMRQEPVTAELIESFPEQLREGATGAMPFLKKLQRISIQAGSETTTLEIDRADGELKLISAGRVERCWSILSGTFEDLAAELKGAHPNVIEDARSAVVTIAVPLGDHISTGRLYATLPTEESSHLPLLINADFFPASDRKRIRFDDAPQGDWNRAAIEAAAQVLAAQLEGLPAKIGDQRVVALLIAAKELGARATGPDADGSFGAFWKELTSRIPDAVVVPVEGGGFGSPRQVRLWNEATELDAVPLLRRLGVRLVARSVKDDWYVLRSADVPCENLHLRHLVGALTSRGATKQWRGAAGEGAVTPDDLPVLWDLLETLLSIKDRSNEAARDGLRGCAVAPAVGGFVTTLRSVHRLDERTRHMLDGVGAATPQLDDERLGSDRPQLAAQVATATAAEVVSWLESALAGTAEPSETGRAEVLSWLHKHHDELDAEELGRAAALPIFPTATGRRPLRGLALPGDFRDELALAKIVALDGIEDMRSFLERLGAQRLSLASYCTEFLAPAVASATLSDLKREKAVRLLATRLSEFRDDRAVRSALSPLQLVRCTDGAWRQGSEVYLRDDVALIVGPGVPLAAMPLMDRSAHGDLYGWLGAAEQPRPADVHARCQSLLRGGDGHREAVGAIVAYVAQQFAIDEARAAVDYAPLRDVAWLPVKGDRSRGHRPAIVYLTFRRSLFSSQAKFLDLDLPLEQAAASFLRWLGLQQEPEPEQVVAHLLAFAQRGEPVGEDVWQYLDLHAAAPALDALRGRACLLLRESRRYVAPGDVYWGPHPFGRWRHQLAPSFAQHRRLLDRLGVEESPSPEDAIEVLLSIGADHGGERGRVLSDDVLVVRACWHLLSNALADGEVDHSDLAELRNAEVVLDDAEWLRCPDEVYFRDSLTLAARFGAEVAQCLIERPEGLWPALAGAGVRNLSDAVTTDIVEQQLLEGGGVLEERMRGRRRMLLRVLARHVDQAGEVLEQLSGRLVLQRLGGLRIRQSLEVAGESFMSEPFDRAAHYLKQEHQLLWVEDEGVQPSWLEVAREVVRALEIAGDVAPAVASVLRGVLGAATPEIARQELDELGYPALDEWDEAGAEPHVTEGLGGAPLSETSVGDLGTTTPGEQKDRDPDCDSDSDSDSDGGRADEDAASSRGPGASSKVGSETTAAVGSTGEQGDPAEGGRPGGKAAAAKQSKLRSYVAPATSISIAGDASDAAAKEIDRKAVDAAMQYERDHGRDPKEQEHENPGYDIRSEAPGGEVRYIEVKGTAVRWGEQGVAISSRQYLEGTRRREDFWLYVVDHALSKPHVHPIQDPISQIDQYFFDDGWRSVSERADVPRPPLLQLRLADVPDGLLAAIPLRAMPSDDSSGWLNFEHPERDRSWFATRIEGEAAGMKFRGGIAIVRPLAGEPEEDDRVLARLIGRVDRDTGSPFVIRLWAPDHDDLGRLIRVRLLCDNSLDPITVEQRDQVEVLGEVMAMLDVSDLQERGYL